MAIHFHRKTLKQMQAEADWSEAEQTLLDEAHTGEVIIAETRPEVASDANRIRAELIRHITLGGCETCRVPDKGVAVAGAFITGTLDLQGCDTPLSLWLDNCRFDSQPNLMDARLGAVFMPGCAMPGMNAHRLHVTRDILLSHNFTSKGAVNLNSAQIGQAVACVGCTVDGQGDTALNMDGINIGADLHLRDGFIAKGLVTLTGANVTGQIACNGGTFDGQGGTALNMNAITVANIFLCDHFKAKGVVDLVGAKVTGQIDFDGGTFDGQGGSSLIMKAVTIDDELFMSEHFIATGLVEIQRCTITKNLRLNGGTFKGGIAAEALTVGGTLYSHDITDWTGPFDLTDAHVGRLHDDAQSWAKADPLILNGFRYDRLSGDMRISERLDWLARKLDKDQPPPPAPDGDGWREKAHRWFLAHADEKATHVDPQPYTHLARVLRDKGMLLGAARVLEARDERISKALFQRALRMDDTRPSASVGSVALAALRRGWDIAVMRPVFGYGQQPIRALKFVLMILVFNTALYFTAYRTGQMAPTSDVVLTSSDWVSAVDAYDNGTGRKPMLVWADSASAQDYTTFNAPLYAFDLFIPLDALGQEAAWAPSPVRGFWGMLGFATGWLTQLLGWMITAIAAAAVAGIVGKKD